MYAMGAADACELIRGFELNMLACVVQEVCRQASELLRSGDENIHSSSGTRLRVRLVLPSKIDLISSGLCEYFRSK